MVASDSFAEFLREQLAPLGRVTMRRMFGKTGVFCDGALIDPAFWRVPERLIDEPDELLDWARAALAAGRGVAAKRKCK